MLTPIFRWFYKQKVAVTRMLRARARAKHSAPLSTAAAANMEILTHVSRPDTRNFSRTHVREHTATPMTMPLRHLLVQRQITSSHFAPVQPGTCI